MIKPINLTQTITQGTNEAIAKFSNDGLEVKFIKSTPEFTTEVGKIVDTFMYSNRIPKTQEGLQQLVQDTFERSSNAIK